MKLVVGLGNPGRQYVGTRHNVGFETVDELARRLGWTGSREDFDRLARSNFEGLMMDGLVGPADRPQKLVLLKPMTYMNNAGRAVQAASAFYQLSPADVLIVLDDMALPAGRIRLRAGGSDGGHNGLRDIERALGTRAYPRLRIGIDAPPSPVPARDYVLARFTPEQRRAVEPAIVRAAAAAQRWIADGIVAAMNEFNAPADEQDGGDDQTA